MSGKMTAWLGFIDADQKANRKQCRASGDNDKDKNYQSADILLFGTRTKLVNGRCENRKPSQREHAKRERIPSGDRFGGKADMAAQRKENGGRGSKGNHQPMACVLPGNQVENARHTFKPS